MKWVFRGTHLFLFVKSLGALCWKSLMTHNQDCILYNSMLLDKIKAFSLQGPIMQNLIHVCIVKLISGHRIYLHQNIVFTLCHSPGNNYSHSLSKTSFLPAYLFPIKPALQHQRQMCIALFLACLFKCQTRLRNNPSKTNIQTAFTLTGAPKISI